MLFELTSLNKRFRGFWGNAECYGRATFSRDLSWYRLSIRSLPYVVLFKSVSVSFFMVVLCRPFWMAAVSARL